MVDELFALLDTTKKNYESKFFEKWDKYDKLFEGDHWDLLEGKVSDANMFKIQVNYPFSLVYTILPSLFFRTPYIKATFADNPSIDAKWREQIALETLVINREVRSQDKMLKLAMWRTLLDALVLEFGAVKLGYATKNKSVKGESIKGEVTEIKTSDAFFIERIDPKDIIFDYTKDTFDEVPWVAIRYSRRIKHLKEKGFNGLDNITAMQDSNKNGKNIYDDVIDIWEYWEKPCPANEYKAQHKILHLESKTVLLSEDAPYNFFPIEFLTLYSLRNGCTGKSSIDLIGDLALELDFIRSKEVTSMRRFNRLFAGSTELDSATKEALVDTPDGKYLRIADPNFRAIEIPGMPMDARYVQQDIKQDSREVMAVADFNMAVQDRTRSATEASLMNRGTQQRSGILKERFAMFVESVINKIGVIIKENYYEYKNIFIATRAGDGLDIRWNKDMLRHDIGYEIDVNTMFFTDMATRKNNAIELLSLLTSNPNIYPMVVSSIPSLLKEIISLYGLDYLNLEIDEAMAQQQKEADVMSRTAAMEQANQQMLQESMGGV